WYWRSGVSAITVHANIDVGGYTWARQGFGWNEWDQTSSGVMSLFRRFQAYASARDQVELWQATVRNNPDDPSVWPSPYEMAMFGYEDREPDPRHPGKETWVGKRAMLTTDWYGRKPRPEEGDA
ncbi:MAG TPA: hypothetical protein VJ788_02775, partial [Gemmatimonadota bacterium]|nr:hypothetical protein [Gemmatimonadota bacterium]